MAKRILYIDPVPASAQELQSIANYLADIKAPDTRLDVVGANSNLPLHITYPSYEALASADLLKLIRHGAQQGFDAIISGCFTAALKKAEMHAEMKQQLGWNTSHSGTLTPPPEEEIAKFNLFDDSTPPLGARIVVK